jgi:hypothetical protein
MVAIDLEQAEVGGQLAPRTDLIEINELILMSGKGVIGISTRGANS